MSALHVDREAITQVIRDYLEGLYQCDTELLASVFHPQALYATAVGAEPLILGMDAYLPMVAKRDPPARTQAARHERILEMDIAGPETAFVKLACRFFQKDYVDYLTLIRLDRRWMIISKVFHYEMAS